MMPALAMPRVTFAIEDAQPESYAQTPTMIFGVRVHESDGAEVESIALGCQVRIEPHRRRYEPAEQELLLDLFGHASRWGQTLRPFLLAQVSTLVPRFTGSSRTELPIPFTYDLDVASARYLHALGDGAVPLLFLFSGTVFRSSGGGLQASPVPWACEARFELPVSAWRALMELYFPGGGWLRLRRESLDGLTRYKASRGLLGWDEVVADLLGRAGA
jgi:hypothetical protein